MYSNKDLNDLLQIIDNRINKSINQSKLVHEYCGIVSQDFASSSEYCKVMLTGGEAIFKFPNKTGISLNMGDVVYVRTIGTDLNTGFISYAVKKGVGDVVLEMGTDENGVWVYEKYASGKLICRSMQNVEFNLQPNSLVELELPYPNFPLTFKSDPNLKIDIKTSVQYKFWYCHSNYTQEKILKISLVTSEAQETSIQCELCIEATGQG